MDLDVFVQLPPVQLLPKQLWLLQPLPQTSHPELLQEPDPEVPHVDVQVTSAIIGCRRPDAAS